MARILPRVERLPLRVGCRRPSPEGGGVKPQMCRPVIGAGGNFLDRGRVASWFVCRKMAAAVVQKHCDGNIRSHATNDQVERAVTSDVQGREHQNPRRSCEPSRLSVSLGELNLDHVIRTGRIESVYLQSREIRVAIAGEVCHGEAQRDGTGGNREVRRRWIA